MRVEFLVKMDQNIQTIGSLRKSRQLHTTVEKRIAQVLSKVVPDFHPVAEPLGLAGGRNDLMLFEFSGKKVLFEIFATASQVSRDLRILDKTKADVKIAVIVDKEVDPKVLEHFLRENPEDNYPFIFIGELLNDQPIECLLKLRQLIVGDEEAIFQRILLKKLSAPNFIEKCRQEGIDIPDEKAINSGYITFQQIFVTLIAAKLRKLGVNQERLIALMRWISGRDVAGYAIMKISAGFNTFLYTDMGGTMAVYSDRELVDWLAISYEFSKPYVLLSLNAVVYEILDKFLLQDMEIDRSIRITIGRSTIYKTPYGRDVELSIPRNTRRIMVFLPSRPMSDEKEEVTGLEYQSIMDFY